MSGGTISAVDNSSMTALSPQSETVSEAVGLLISEAHSQTWGRWGILREGSEATAAAYCYSPSTALSVTEEAGEVVGQTGWAEFLSSEPPDWVLLVSERCQFNWWRAT